MLHYILIILAYSLFIGIIYDQKKGGKMGGDTVDWTVPIGFGAIYFFCLTFLYEKLLQYILLKRVGSYEGYTLFSAVGSGVYLILFFFGLIMLGILMDCKLPNIWTILVFIISLVINVILITKSTNLYYEAMKVNFGDHIFEDFYTSLSKTTRPDMANTLLNLKWIVMICPGVFYLIQLLIKKKN